MTAMEWTTTTTTTPPSTKMDVKDDMCMWAGLPMPVNGVPIDSDGYIQSFGVADVKQYQVFYKEYGFVVIRDVLTDIECAETISDIWSIVETKSGGTIKRTDPKTWSDSKTWSAAAGPLAKTEGMIGTGAIFTPTAVRNRCNLAMFSVAQHLLGQQKLLVSHDRYGLFRPTVSSSSSPTMASTMANLHLDMNPWRTLGGQTTKDQLSGLTYKQSEEFLDENNLPLQLPALQMLINLADNKEDDGGLQVVPRFPSMYLADWIKSSKQSLVASGLHDLDDNFIRLTDDDPMHKLAIRVTARPGSLIVWDKLMVHGSQPNRSSRPRYAQFFLMFPAAPMSTSRAKHRAKAITTNLQKININPSTLPKHVLQLFGLQPYP
jgi:ectoine hydroxylase-related dioxygenase (phytanoyl-CoA dioxygenase family)